MIDNQSSILNDLLSELENIDESNLERHRKKLLNAQRLITNVGMYKDLPLQILDTYMKFSEIIEGQRAKNPKQDLQIYDNLLQTLLSSINYIEYIAHIEQQHDYNQSIIQGLNMQLNQLNNELIEYRGIESAILNKTLEVKIQTVLNKIKL